MGCECESLNGLLPPANEVWGKVIFLHMCVILSTGGRVWLWGACVVAGRCTWLWGRAWLAGICSCTGGVCGCGGRGHAWLGVCVVARGCVGYDEIRSMSVRILLECILVNRF